MALLFFGSSITQAQVSGTSGHYYEDSVLNQQDSVILSYTNDTSFWHQNKTVFSGINPLKISSGILADYGYTFAKLSLFDGTSITDSNKVCFPILEQINATLYSSRIRLVEGDSLKTPQALYDAWKNNATTNHLAISGILYAYQKYDSNSLSKVSVSNGVISDRYDSSGNFLNPYATATVFAMSLPISSLNSRDVSVNLPTELWQSNLNSQISEIKVDADDGLGYRTLVRGGSNLNVHYSDTGRKDWLFELSLLDGRVLHAHSSILIGMERRTYVDDVVDITATEAYNSVYAKAKISIQYAHSDHILRKPLIIVEGIDFGTILNPQEEFGSYDIEKEFSENMFYYVPSNSILKQEIQNGAYDLIFVDWVNGSDYIERNALALEEVIRHVNSHKSGTAQNVVWGFSMGGLVSRYALKNMELKSENHQVRLFISHDAPQLGANVPLGYQQMSDHLRSYTLGTGFLQSTIQNFVVPVTGSVSLNDALSLAYQPAAAEMIIQHISPWGRSIHATWQQSLKNKGYPSLCRNIAVSNGSECGMSQPLVPAEKLFSFDGNANTGWLSDLLLYFSGTIFPAANAIAVSGLAATFHSILPPTLGFIPGSNEWDLDFWVDGDADGTKQQLYYGKISYTKNIFWALPISQVLTIDELWHSNAYPWETFPGGYYTYPNIESGSIPNINSSLGDFSGSLYIKNRFCFIPIPSALDIGGGHSALTKSKFQARYIGAQPPANPFNSQFDNFVTDYSPDSIAANNRVHTELNALNAGFVGSEMAGTHPQANCESICLDNAIVGPNYVCNNNSGSFSIPSTSGVATTWTVSPTTGLTLTASGNTCNVAANSTVSGLYTLFAFVNTNTDCGSLTFTKNFSVGLPNPNIILGDKPCAINITMSPYAPKSFAYEWSTDGTNFAADAGNQGPFFDKYNSFSYPADIYLKISNSCGISTKHHSITVPKSTVYCAARILNPNAHQAAELDDIKVFPNPFSDVLHITIGDKTINTIRIELRDVKGSLVYYKQENNVQQQDISIPLVSLAVGVYQLRIVSNVKTDNFKLFKN